MDYKVSEVTELKAQLERKILHGLSELVNAFTCETGILISDLTVEFVDVSSLTKDMYIPSRVTVSLKLNNLNVG